MRYNTKLREYWQTILKPILEQKWWQGFGGIAQLVAAIFTLISLKHASKMLKLAKKERKDSVSPAWDIVKQSVTTRFLADESKCYSIRGHISLRNTGFGPARNITIDFDTFNGNKPTNIHLNFVNKCSEKLILPDENNNAEYHLSINLQWNIKEPPIGHLIINCYNRIGNKITKKIYIETYNIESKRSNFSFNNFGNWDIEWVENRRKPTFWIKLNNIKNKVIGYIINREDFGKIDKMYKMEKWVRDTFEVKGNNFLHEESGTGIRSVSVRNFVRNFSKVENIPPTASELKSIMPKRKDWNKRFKMWVDEGIIKKGTNKNVNKAVKEGIYDNWYEKLEEIEPGQVYNPYAGRDSKGNWMEGSTSKKFLKNNFGQYTSAKDMKKHTESKGLKKYFDYLANNGIIKE